MSQVQLNLNATQSERSSSLQEVAALEPSYLIKFQQIVAKCLAQLNRIADKDRSQIDSLKEKYRISTQKSADLTRDLGIYGLGSPVLSLITVGAGALAGQQKIGEFVATQWVPRLGNLLFETPIQADLKQVDGLSSLTLSEYQSKTSENQSDASNKQEIIGLLDRALQAIKDAARAG